MQYNILWVDDRKDEFVELDYHNKLIEYVSEQFFDASLDFWETVDEGKKAIETKKYDVIFSDYNIGDNDKGDDFISFVRSRNVNTEILCKDTDFGCPNFPSACLKSLLRFAQGVDRPPGAVHPLRLKGASHSQAGRPDRG